MPLLRCEICSIFCDDAHGGGDLVQCIKGGECVGVGEVVCVKYMLGFSNG